MPPKKGAKLPDSIEWVEHNCYCLPRVQAMVDGQFLYSKTWKGWYFLHGPRRTMSAFTREQVYIIRGDYNHPDHGGEPYIYPTCPWCFGELPNPPPFVQADGGPV